MSGYPSEFIADLEFVVGIEGGKSDRKNDKGGRTNHGITQRRYNDWRRRNKLPARDVYLIEIHEIKAIYFEIWEQAKCDEWKMPLRRLMFDTATNWHPRTAIRFLQQALGVGRDGIVGPITRKNVAKWDNKKLCSRIVDIRVDFRADRCIADPTQLEFLKGWLRRDVKLDRASR